MWWWEKRRYVVYGFCVFTEGEVGDSEVSERDFFLFHFLSLLTLVTVGEDRGERKGEST